MIHGSWLSSLGCGVHMSGARIESPEPRAAVLPSPREVRMTRLISPRVMLVLGLLAALSGVMVQAQRSSSSASMATAAERFLASLTPEQRQQATFSFDSAERMRWHFVPQFERNGLQLKAMTEPQRKAAHELLKTGLSDRGYTTYTQIMQLENILREVEKGKGPTRDPEGYRFSVFGTPSAKGTWAWRVEFHHVSLHFTVVNGTAIASTPSFAGANPAEVRDGPQKGQRTLGPLEDTARALVTALDANQRKTAIFNTVALNDIVTENALDINPLSPSGLKASEMTAAQRDLLMKIVDSYAGLMAVGHRRGPAGEDQDRRRREHHVRLGGRHRAGPETLLSRAGPHVPDRVRQHAERWESRPLGVARFPRRLRARPAARASQDVVALRRYEHETRSCESCFCWPDVLSVSTGR